MQVVSSVKVLMIVGQKSLYFPLTNEYIAKIPALSKNMEERMKTELVLNCLIVTLLLLSTENTHDKIFRHIQKTKVGRSESSCICQGVNVHLVVTVNTPSSSL